ncbi:MAG: thiol reductant ABC exporter subunit CydD [Methylovulum sp.]|nr:thiol reductant ABC exporter subunit CydD [Methylovulum sp.]
MRLTDNQVYFDHRQAREKICAYWLKQQAKTVAKPVRLTAIAGIANGCAVMVQAAIIAQILHAIIIDNRAWQDLGTPLLGLAAVFIARSLCVYCQQIWGFEAGAQVRLSLRRQLSDQFAALGPVVVKQQHSGELTAITLEQVDALENYFARYLPQQLIVGVLPLIMIVVVMPVNWVVGVIFLLTGPLIPVFMALAGMGAASASRNQFLAMTRMGGYFLDRLQGLATLKLFGQAWQELERINAIADNFRAKTMAVLRIAFISSAVLEFFSAVAVALVAVYVGLGLLGQISLGPAKSISFKEALFVLLLAPEFFMPLRQLAVYYHDKAAALGSADAILALLEQQVTEQSPVGQQADPTAQLIELKQVSKSYGARQVLYDIDLSISAREKIALTGPSGAGKTTLVNLLLGFEPASAGIILLNGRAIDRDSAATAIAWAGQDPYLFHGSIKDNIALAHAEADEQAIIDAAIAAGVTEFSGQLPDGLLTLIGERGYGLSGGQIQRIALARAFLKNADIILLDEPTANLDPANKTRLLDVIGRLFSDKTLIIASHDPEVIQRMDRRLVLHQGRLLP